MVLALFYAAGVAAADPIRVASYDTELSRKGPGILYRDILKEEDQVMAVAAVLAANAPDIVALQSFDFDHDLLALTAFRDVLAGQGLHLPYMFARLSNSGVQTGLDLDGDGRIGGPRDAQGYGRFAGHGGMALLSRYPITPGALDFSDLLWQDLPDGPDRQDVLTPEQATVQRLSSAGHWVVPIRTPMGRLDVLMSDLTPPVFDGPEDRNGKRNADEIRLWLAYLDGALGPPPEGAFVILANLNNDPVRGEGLKPALHRLLSHPLLQDPFERGSAAPTVQWARAGNLRVDYVLPSNGWQLSDFGVVWPNPIDPHAQAVEAASRHRLVWADLTAPPH